jgi:hypothetical protein
MHPSEIPVAPSQILLVIGAARACQQDLEQKGLWQVIPERRAEFLRVLQLIDKCAYALSVTLQHNRTQMAQDRSSPVWGTTGAELKSDWLLALLLVIVTFVPLFYRNAPERGSP